MPVCKAIGYFVAVSAIILGVAGFIISLCALNENGDDLQDISACYTLDGLYETYKDLTLICDKTLDEKDCMRMHEYEDLIDSYLDRILDKHGWNDCPEVNDI